MQTLSFSKSQSWLAWFLRGILILGTLFLLGRLIELQIIKGSYYRQLAEGNRIRRVPITAPRGKILARGGEVLVGNVEVKKRVVFKPDSGYTKTTDIEGALPEEVISEWQRDYKLGASFAHVSGYLGEVNKSEVGKIDPRCPQKGPRRLGAYIGRGGLEEEYECLLSGMDGEELVEVDSTGKRVRTLGRKEPMAGQDLQTSIHYGLQQKVAAAMAGKRGAVVVTDTQGEVLALYSSPSFNPNFFVKGGYLAEVKKILNSPDLPLFDRAIGGTFPPGSIFKPIVAIAGLEEGKIDKDFTYEDRGQIEIKTIYGNFTYSNWYFTQYGRVEGEIDLTKALARSTDTFFYYLGELLGVEDLIKWARRFGLDEKTGIDLPGEVAGFIPTPEWKKKVKGERWFLGNTYHLSIGQGDLSLSPLQINRALAVIASGGKLCQPKIAAKPTCQKIDIREQNIELVKEGMIKACRQGGTAFPFFDFKLKDNPERSIACKTGTAEINEGDKTHAWFGAFAPADFPEIVVTVLVEEGGEGSSAAGPIAREIIDYWFFGEEPKGE